MKNKNIIIYIIILLTLYIVLTNLVETKLLYPVLRDEEDSTFSFYMSYPQNSEDCIEINSLSIFYYNDLDSKYKNLKKEKSFAKNLLNVRFYVDQKKCFAKEIKIHISASKAISPILEDSLNQSYIKNKTTGFDIFLENNEFSDRFLELYIPINQDFFDFYNFNTQNDVGIDMVQFEFKTDVFKGYYAKEESFSLIMGKTIRETSIYKGGSKLYRFEDTSDVKFRFSPIRKLSFLLQKILDALILGIIAMFFYLLIKKTYKPPKNPNTMEKKENKTIKEIHKWIRKPGENWSELKVDLSRLNLDQSLKVQEMFDNKEHQRFERKQLKKQEQFNKILVYATIIIALVGVAQVFNNLFPSNPISNVLIGLALVFFVIMLGIEITKLK